MMGKLSIVKPVQGSNQIHQLESDVDQDMELDFDIEDLTFKETLAESRGKLSKAQSM